VGEFAWIGPLVAAIGPTAFAFALVAGVLFYFYRRDHLQKQVDLREERRELMAVVVKNTESHDRLASAVDSLSKAFDRSAR
jgi:hypothetical protein